VEGSYLLRVEVELPLSILGEELAGSFEELMTVGLHKWRAYRDPKVHGWLLEARKHGCPWSAIQLHNFHHGDETNEPFVV